MAVELDKLAGKDGGDESRRLAKHWLEQIERLRDTAEYKRWIKRGDTIEKRYRDERNRVDEEGQRRYNALWANVEILRPALYGKTPVPICERRFHDKDPVGRGAAEILERGLRNEIEINGYHEAMLQAVNDYLLPGRGVVWVRYEPEIQDSVSLPPDSQTDMRDERGSIDADNADMKNGVQQGKRRDGNKRMRFDEDEESEGETDRTSPSESRDEDDQSGAPDKTIEEQKLADTGDRIVRESVPVDYVSWQDFFTLPVKARTWVEVTAVVKRVYMSRDQMRKRFGKEIANGIPLSRDDRGQRVQYSTPDIHTLEDDKGQIFEIWNRIDQTVYWIAHGYEYLCDRKDDPLRLANFFPCPKPIYANSTNSTLMPVPDYIQYQDQAIQLDELTQRIAMLTRACKMAGVYNAAADGIRRLFDESVENELIPVDDWAAFAEKGGVEGNWSLMPVQEIIQVLNELITARQKVKEDMDQLTGINDIMRGTSDARETLGGVRLKNNNTGTRLTARQNEIARFARDVVRLMADVMAQHFSPQSLIEVSGALYEEGLGPKDMPELTALQQSQQSPAPPQAPRLGGPPMPPQAPPMGQQPAGSVPPTASPQIPPNPGAGGNVVPFRPPGAPQQPPQMGAPAGPPAPMQGMPQAPGQGMMLPAVPPQVQAQMLQMAEQFAALKRISDAINLIRDEKLRGFRVDIEVDSTIFPDMQEEKQERTQFITAVTQFLGQGMQLGASSPSIIPLLGKLLQFGVRGFHVGRDLEAAIEDFTDKAAVEAKQAQERAQSQPNPEMLKAQTDAHKASAQIQAIQMKTQAEGQAHQAELQRGQMQMQSDQAKAQADVQSSQMDQVMKQMEFQIEQLRLQIEQIKAGVMQQKAGAEVEQAHAQTQQAHAQTQQMQMQGQHQQQQHQHESQQMQHQASMDQQRMAHEERQSQFQAANPAPQPKPTGTE